MRLSLTKILQLQHWTFRGDLQLTGIHILREISCALRNSWQHSKTPAQLGTLLHFDSAPQPLLVPVNMSKEEPLSNNGKKWARLLRNTLHSKLVIKMEQEKSEDQIFSWKLTWIILDPDDCIWTQETFSVMPSNQVIPASGNNNQKKKKKAYVELKWRGKCDASVLSFTDGFFFFLSEGSTLGDLAIQSCWMLWIFTLKEKNSYCMSALQGFRDCCKQPKIILFLITLNILFGLFPAPKVKCFFLLCMCVLELDIMKSITLIHCKKWRQNYIWD